MHNVCPNESELVEFALMPLLEENVDIAVHVLHCEECVRKLALINQVLLADSEVSPEEWAEIKSFSPHLKTEGTIGLWEELEKLLTPLNFTWSDTPEGPRWTRLAAATSFQTQFPGDEQKKSAANNRIIDLTFEANCETTCTLFWRAVMHLTLHAGEEMRQPISISDGCGMPISEGRLALCGQILPVVNGQSDIALCDFRNGLANREVSMKFMSGAVMDGSLVYALEDVL